MMHWIGFAFLAVLVIFGMLPAISTALIIFNAILTPKREPMSYLEFMQLKVGDKVKRNDVRFVRTLILVKDEKDGGATWRHVSDKPHQFLITNIVLPSSREHYLHFEKVEN